MPIEKYSDDELNELTDAERAALLDGSDDDEDDLEIKGLGDDGKTDDAEDKAAKADDGAAAVGTPVLDDAAAAAPVADAEPAPAVEAKSAEPAAAPVQVAPVFVAAAPDDADAKLAALDARRTDARTQYNAGEIDHDAYEALKDEIAEEKLELKLAIQTANISAQMQQQAAQQAWYDAAAKFADEHGYRVNPETYQIFESVVVSVANSEAGQAMNAHQILEAANKKMVAAGMGKAAAVAAPAPAPAKTAAAKPVQPPNLALVPAAATENAEAGKYANLDRLQASDPERYEEELMKMSESAQDAYLRAAG
jgi:hypothetical protein